MIDSEIVVGTGLKVSVSREELSQKLGVVSRGVSTRTAVLVLGGIQLRAEGGRLELAATDMELSLRAVLDVDAGGDGEVVVPGKLLLDIVRALPENDVEIEHRREASVVAITSGSASYR